MDARSMVYLLRKVTDGKQNWPRRENSSGKAEAIDPMQSSL